MSLQFNSAYSFLNDIWSVEGQLQNPHEDFCFSGKIPLVGQTVEAQITDCYGQIHRFRGLIIFVTENETLLSTLSKGDREIRSELVKMITPANDCFTTYSLLHETNPLISKSDYQFGTLYRIEYKANEDLSFLYSVSSIQELSYVELLLLPRFVQEFFLKDAVLF